MFTKEEFKKIRLYSVIAAIIICIYIILNNLPQLTGYLNGKLKVISPIIVGFMIAYVLNIPMRFFELKVFDKIKFMRKKKRGLALLSTLIACVLLLIGFFSFVVPQLVQSAESLVDIIPTYLEKATKLVDSLIAKYDFNESIMQKIQDSGAMIIQYVSNLMMTLGTSLLDISSNILSGVFNTVVSLVLAIYMLLNKEKLIRTIKKIALAFMSSKIAGKVAYGVEITDHAFTGFVRGQLIEAFIIGVTCFLGLTVFGFQYALLISVLVGVTNVIPIFGPFIGAVPSVIILFTVSPAQAVWFIVFIIVLQQIEGNIIYPRVVGSSIGLSGFWVLTAVIVGNNLYGLLGIIIGIPIFATIYALMRKITDDRLKKKNIVVK